MTAADQTPAKRCGECRLGLGVHTTTDPYCDHHQTPATPIAGAMALTELLANFLDGDERGWAAEFDFLRREHASRIDDLTASIRQAGITTPIVLGNDGRVWDGHHRLCVAEALGLVRVPVIQTPATDSGRDERLREALDLVQEARVSGFTQIDSDTVFAIDDEVARLAALLAEQAATIERVREVADTWVKHSGQRWSCDNDDVRASCADVILDALGSQRTEGQG